MRYPGEACRHGNEKMVFLGDSYVGQYERAFIDEFESFDLGFISFSYGQCPFVSDQIWFDNVAECPFVNEQCRSIISKFDDPKIFIVSVNERQFAAPKKRTENPLADGKENRRAGEQVDSLVAWNSYFEGVEWLVQKGHKVVLIRTIPRPKINAPKWLADNVKYISDMSFPQIYNNSNPTKMSILDNKRYPKFDPKNVLVIDLIDVLCDRDKDRCLDVKKGYGPLYNGGRHQSYLGAALMADLVNAKLLEHGWLERKDSI